MMQNGRTTLIDDNSELSCRIVYVMSTCLRHRCICDKAQVIHCKQLRNIDLASRLRYAKDLTHNPDQTVQSEFWNDVVI